MVDSLLRFFLLFSDILLTAVFLITGVFMYERSDFMNNHTQEISTSTNAISTHLQLKPPAQKINWQKEIHYDI